MAQFEQKIKEAYECIRQEGLALIPTPISYGLIGHSEESIGKMYRIKGRPLSNKSIVFANPSFFRKVSVLEEDKLKVAEKLASKYMMSFVCPINPDSPFLTSLDPFVFQQATKDNTIALYMNLGRFADGLVELGESDNFLLVGSSANISHTGNNYTLKDVEPEILRAVDFVYDDGVCAYHHPTGRPGTIVDMRTLKSNGDIQFVRKGALYPEIYGAIKHMLTGKIEYPQDMDSYLEKYCKSE